MGLLVSKVVVPLQEELVDVGLATDVTHDSSAAL